MNILRGDLGDYRSTDNNEFRGGSENPMDCGRITRSESANLEKRSRKRQKRQ